MLGRLSAAYRRVTKNLRERREVREYQERIEREKRRGREKAQAKRLGLLRVLADELAGSDPDPIRVSYLKGEIAEAHAKAQERDGEHDHASERLAELRSKIAWGAKRRTTLRRKIREAREEKTPTPQSWHGNGHEWWNLTGRAKILLAIAVVKYGLYCTSITRGWGTGSHHEDVPTHGFDCGGAGMTEFQQDLRYGRIDGFALGDLLELFGPDNAACADNGQPYSMAEGSAIEQLHDNHTHAFVYGA